MSCFVHFAIFFFIFVFFFVGGGAALLYFVFSKYTGVQNIWLLVCGAPVALIVLLVFILFNLYTRFGKPLEQLFNAINKVEEGDLSVRVPENKSDMFSDLIKRFNKMIGELGMRQTTTPQPHRRYRARTPHAAPYHSGQFEGVIDGVYEPTPEHINNTLDETKLLARLVNDLQTLPSLRRLPLHPTRFLLADLIADLTTSFASRSCIPRHSLDPRRR